MGKLHPHYGNLKVVRNALSDVIRATYKTPVQECLPDKRPGSADTERVMASQPTGHAKSVLVAHVISNWLLYFPPGFVLWIWANDSPRKPAPGPKLYQAKAAPPVSSVHAPSALSVPTPYQLGQPLAIPEKAKSTAAPNGEPWPVGAGYVDGHRQLQANELPTVTVDNSRNDL